MRTIVLLLLTPSFAFFFTSFFSSFSHSVHFSVYSKTTHFSTYVKCLKCKIGRESERAPHRFFFLNGRFHIDERKTVSLFIRILLSLIFFLNSGVGFFFLALFFSAVLSLRSFLLSHLIFVFCAYFHNRPTGN